MKRRLLWSTGLVLLTGVAALALRPAHMLAARVTTIAPGNPPVASVALTYGPGMAPASVIVDVRDHADNGGSATVAGAQLFLEVPLIGALSGDHHVRATATYRLLGMPLTRVREFAAAMG